MQIEDGLDNYNIDEELMVNQGNAICEELHEDVGHSSNVEVASNGESRTQQPEDGTIHPSSSDDGFYSGVTTLAMVNNISVAEACRQLGITKRCFNKKVSDQVHAIDDTFCCRIY